MSIAKGNNSYISSNSQEESDSLSARERVLLELILKANSLKAMRVFGGPGNKIPKKGGSDDQMRIIH